MITDRLIDSAFFLLAEGGAHPPLQFRVDTLIFSLIIFGALLAILFVFAWKPIMEGLDAREKKMSDDIENARVANEKSTSQSEAV